MALVAPVTNGKVESVSTEETKKEQAKATGSDLGYDQFLQILCAEMQYQDPLEPTSNTEYIAQLATFSQLESTLDLNDKVTSSMANDLVGKYVIMKTTSSTTGETSYKYGTVDYILYQDGDTLLALDDGGFYSIDDLDTVSTPEYMDGVTMAKTFSTMIAKLPSVSKLTISDEGSLKEARKYYDALTDYQKKFVSTTDVETLETLEKQMSKLKGDTDDGTTGTGTDTKTDDSTTDTDNKTEGTESTE